MSLWDWDGIGETLTGISTSAKSIYDDWSNTGEENTQAAASAAPELNRETQPAAQQPTGAPVTMQGYGMNQQTLLMGGLIILAVVVLLIVFKR
ncbi:hypothetical protein CSW98_14080 [Vibrio sp. HA2012]|uniref:hypothetical protein n=1 Tax=Vibrio sp. HA2012 TaxID=1971595 RepID=UPI000C2B7DF1|nr:hypothetical protein [Vibrio sp. HA2012]PJC85701.1 hypothetical protein CSW98_14080 [Vibrio sp. HA2012]